jgi:putative transposase
MVRGDGAYAGAAARWLAAERGRRVEAPRRRDRQLRRRGLEAKSRGFRVTPRGRVVERTFAWLARSRRLARGYERPPETGGAMTHAAVGRTMLRRLAT